MPSQRPTGALLALAAPPDNEDDLSDNFIHHPWGWSTWQKRTGILNTPFTNTSGVWKNKAEAEAVKAFAESFWEMGDPQRTSHMRVGLVDNHSHGRKAWGDFVRNNWNCNWKVEETIMDILAEKSLDPHSCMRRAKSCKVGKISLSSTENCCLPSHCRSRIYPPLK